MDFKQNTLPPISSSSSNKTIGALVAIVVILVIVAIVMVLMKNSDLSQNSDQITVEQKQALEALKQEVVNTPPATEAEQKQALEALRNE